VNREDVGFYRQLILLSLLERFERNENIGSRLNKISLIYISSSPILLYKDKAIFSLKQLNYLKITFYFVFITLK